MSIASETNPTRGDGRCWYDKYLFEPDSADIKVSIIAGASLSDTQQTPMEIFAETLLELRRGIVVGETAKTLATIDLLVELAYLETGDHAIGLERFRAKVTGRLRPNGSYEPEEGEANATSPAAVVAEAGDLHATPACHEVAQLDESGGHLPPVPISAALRGLLEADARRCFREPLGQVVTILEYHYGRYKPEKDPRFDVNKDPAGGAAPTASALAADERLNNAMRLGEHIAAILDNPETPGEMYNALVDKVLDLINSTQVADEVRLNWPRIVERLLAESGKRGVE